MSHLTHTSEVFSTASDIASLIEDIFNEDFVKSFFIYTITHN